MFIVKNKLFSCLQNACSYISYSLGLCKFSVRIETLLCCSFFCEIRRSKGWRHAISEIHPIAPSLSASHVLKIASLAFVLSRAILLSHKLLLRNSSPAAEVLGWVHGASAPKNSTIFSVVSYKWWFFFVSTVP